MSQVRDFLLAHPVFARDEFVESRTGRSADPQAIDSLLAYHLSRGAIVRLRRGLFATVPHGTRPDRVDPDSMVVVSRLSPDAVLAYHTALEFHGFANSVHRQLTAVSAARVRMLRLHGRTYRAVRPPRTIPAEAGLRVGITNAAREGVLVRVTTRERTLVDCLDRPVVAGGWEEAWASLQLLPPPDIEALKEYLKVLDNRTTAAKLGWFLTRNAEQFPVADDFIADLRSLAPASPVTIERRTGARGRLIAGWNLVVPESLVRRLAALRAR